MNDEEFRERFAAMRDEDRAAASPFESPARTHPAGSRLWSAVAAAASIIAVVGALGVGVAWGTTTGYASGRVEGDRQRAVIAATARGATSALAALRSELVRARSQLDTRGASSASIAAVDAELRAIEASIQRIEIDLMLRASSAAPPPPPRHVSMTRAVALTCAAVGRIVPPARSQEKPTAQQSVPVLDPSGATIQTPREWGGRLGVRRLSNGKVPINDGKSRQTKL